MKAVVRVNDRSSDDLTPISLSSRPEFSPDRAPYVRRSREECSPTAEQIELFLAGSVPKLAGMSQDQLRALRRMQAAVRECEAAIEECDPKIDGVRIRTLRKRCAFLRSEADAERERHRVWLATGAHWGSYERACSLADYRDGLIQAAIEAGEVKEAGPGQDGPMMLTSASVRDRIERDARNELFRRHARGVIEGDDALSAYGLCDCEPRKRLEAAVAQARAGLPVDIMDL